jgi:Glycosyl transferase family 2
VRHAVIIASTRRPHVLEATLRTIAAQSVQADDIIVSLAERGDAPEHLPPGVRVVLGPRGLTRQRNAALDALADDVDLVTFFDDDAEPGLDYLEQAQRFADKHNEVVLFDGLVVADGAVAGQIDRERARLLLAGHERSDDVRSEPATYGCNMTVRAEVARQVLFDERLPLYGWLEDRDFAVRCGRLGGVAQYEGCVAVHLGTSSGRVSGSRMGFSQVVNPHYLRRKGVLRGPQLLTFWLVALLGNTQGLLRRDPTIDRVGRLRGNLIGFAAVVRGIGPEGVLDVDPA